jgi:hypothetical protein
MTDASPSLHRAVFIVRLDRDADGQLTGVVERVRTGEKVRVGALADVGDVLLRMLAADAPLDVAREEETS